MVKLKITLTRSLIGRPATQRATVKALGLHRINSTSEVADSAAVRGQIHKVEHLVTVEEIQD
jgi:large subunit ribosomal protein L30